MPFAPLVATATLIFVAAAAPAAAREPSLDELAGPPSSRFT